MRIAPMVRLSSFLRYRYLKYFPFVVICVCIFLFVNFIFTFLYTSHQKPERERLISWPPHIIAILQRNFHLVNNEWRLISKAKSDNELNCTSLTIIQKKIYVNTGWTKITHRTLIGDTAIAVKNVNLKGHDVSKCVENGQDTLQNCFMKSSLKMLTEIVGLHALQYPNVIKILGYCVPENPNLHNDQQISIMTEFGEMIDTIKLLQMSWDDRLKIALNIARLLYHLTETPLGSVALNDFRRQQFVFVQGVLKLVDIDDISTKSPPCVEKACCIYTQHNVTIACDECKHQICKGYNEKQNIINAGRHFIKHILPHDVPAHLTEIVNTITAAYETATWNSSKILEETENLVSVYKKGLNKNS